MVTEHGMFALVRVALRMLHEYIDSQDPFASTYFYTYFPQWVLLRLLG